MGTRLPRTALWALLALALVLGTSVLPGAWAGDPTSFTLTGQVRANAGGVVSGITVDLTSGATHQVYTTVTVGGTFAFTSANTGGALGPGWWGVSVPPQAKITSTGCSPCAAFPVSTAPQFRFYTGTQLTSGTTLVTVTIQRVLTFGSTLMGTATYSDGTPVAGADVELLDPLYNGLILNNATTIANGTYSMSSPISTSSPGGIWVLQTVIPGPTPWFNFSAVKMTGGTLKVNPVFNPAVQFLTYGYMDNASSPGSGVLTSGNATSFDNANGYIYTQPTGPGGFYAVGTYGSSFGGASNAFTVILSAVGYSTFSFPLTVSSSNPGGSGITLPYNVQLTPITPPANYTTTLNFSSGFSNVNVSTVARLGNYSTLPEIGNASVGQLWAQLGLDFQSSLSFSSTGLPTVSNYLNTSGPFLPANQAGLAINATNRFNQTSATPTTQFGFASTCSGTCGLSTNANLTYTWDAKYNTTRHVGLGATSYVISVNFRHPTNAQSFNYTFVLPTGYVLKANNPVPAHSMLVGAGHQGTYTAFTLVSLPASTAFSQANFTVVKGGELTANVNVTSSNFAWSTQNILDSAHGSYKVLAGVGDNLTFSGQNSTFFPGTTGVKYNWTWGDGSPNMVVTSPFTYHTYAAAGTYTGSLAVTGSSGATNSTPFTVLVGTGSPKAVITTNATELKANGVPYVWVNWGTSLRFNATGSNTTVAGTSAPPIMSGSTWNLTASQQSFGRANFTAGAGVFWAGNFTPALTGGGQYYVDTTVNGVPITFKGWVYTVSLRVFDFSGASATGNLTVLVNDTQKPIAAATILNAAGHPVASTGVTEGANHTAELQFSAVNSTDPNNGTIVLYHWLITNPANASAWPSGPINKTASTAFPVWLAPQARPYAINLTVTDLAGNTNFDNVTVTVAINSTTRPVLVASNLTVPNGGKLTAGSTYTIWVNVTNTVGTASTAQNLQVTFYLLPPSGSGSRINIGGSPAEVTFYNYSSGVVSSTQRAIGSTTLGYNETIRAQITFSPARTGNYNLFANATATNEFYANYGANQVSVAVTLNQNPNTLYLEYAAIGAGAAAVIVGLYIFLRRRRRGPAPKGKPSAGTSKSGLERGSSRSKDEAEDEEE